MSIRRWSARPPTLGLLAALGAVGCADVPSSPMPAAGGPIASMSIPSTTQRYLVQLRPGAPLTLSAATLAQSGGAIVNELDHLNTVVVAGVSNANALRADPTVAVVEVALELSIPPGEQALGFLAPVVNVNVAGDPTAASWYVAKRQWNMSAIDAEGTWGVSTGGAGVKVCIIDTGIDETHVDLAGKVVAQASFVPNPGGSPQLVAIDSNFHGTHVAGTITSNNIGVASLVPHVQLLIAKVFAATGGSPTDRTLQAVKWCADNEADVINMSLGGLRNRADVASLAIQQAGLDYATSRGSLIVAAAGNNNLQLPNPQVSTWPAEADGVLSVGATGPVTKNPPGWPAGADPTFLKGVDNRGFYSNFGTAVNVFAPGGRGNIPLTFRPRGQGNQFDNVIAPCAQVACRAPNGYTLSAGTSMASPHVAAVAAMIRGELAGERSAAMAMRVANCVKASTENIGPASTFGGGRVNASIALSLARSGAC